MACVRGVLAATIASCLAAPARAGDCAALIREFEAAIKTTEANAATVEQAKALVEQARTQDAAGQSDLCVDTVEQALATLAQ